MDDKHWNSNERCNYGTYRIYAQKSPLNAHADVSGRARGLNFSRSLHPHQNFVPVSSKGSDEPAHVRRLA